MENITIYTVGHSTHSLEYFLGLLKKYEVTCLIDVRSIAASSYNPQYNQEPLKNFLKIHAITYLHLAEEFGARRLDPELLDIDGKVDFDKVRKTWSFNNGVERLWQGLNKGFVIALMCSESEPIDCHRFSMISRALVKEGFKVMHIMKDKSLKTNAELEKQLLKKYDKKLPKPDLLNQNVTPEQQLEFAYRLKNKEIGYSTYSKQNQEDNYD
jgi:uncharacterized protein (DUF488 family)